MRYVTLAAAGLLFVGGCNTCPKNCPCCNGKAAPEAQLRNESSAPTATTQVKVYPVAPAELVKRIEAALKAQGFTITSSQAGVIQTDWKDYPGEFHIARRWDEQSRFRISVIPDVSNPTGASRFEVTEETQRRSNSKAAWEEATRRPERAQQLAAAIDSAVGTK